VAQRAEPGAVIRAQRLEIVDDEGRVRAALAADRDNHEGDDIVGLELFAATGETRAWLLDVGGVVQLALALHGNQVAVLESVPRSGGSATTSLVLCDGPGRPVARWSVGADGTYSSSVSERDPG
jgi:hypothetical protein